MYDTLPCPVMLKQGFYHDWCQPGIPLGPATCANNMLTSGPGLATINRDDHTSLAVLVVDQPIKANIRAQPVCFVT